jgi:hypothetical protein
MAVEAIDVVVSALAAGAAAGAKDTASTAVKDAYAGLRAAIGRRFGQARADELATLAQEHADDPQTGSERLRAMLTAADEAPDEDLLAAAQDLLAQLGSAPSRAGKYTVDARDAQGVQIGDNNTMSLTF